MQDSSNLEISYCYLSYSQALMKGGTIMVTRSALSKNFTYTLKLDNVYIQDSYAYQQGGSLYVENDSIDIVI